MENSPIHRVIIVAPICWTLMGLALEFFISHDPHYWLWIDLFFVDLFWIFAVKNLGLNVNLGYSITLAFGLVQITYLLHIYNLNIFYFFLMLASCASVNSSLIYTNEKHVYVYNGLNIIGSLTFLFSQGEHRYLFVFCQVVGVLFLSYSTLNNIRFKDKFVQTEIKLAEAKMYAHEINTPLAVIKGRINQLIKSETSAENLRRLEVANENVDRIAKIIKKKLKP